jgi:hypothetical protein
LGNHLVIMVKVPGRLELFRVRHVYERLKLHSHIWGCNGSGKFSFSSSPPIRKFYGDPGTPSLSGDALASLGRGDRHL